MTTSKVNDRSMSEHYKVTSCWPDTTSFSAKSTDAVITGNNDTVRNTINCGTHDEHSLSFDDCGCDIPSPECTPVEGRRKLKNVNSKRSIDRLID